MNKTSIEWVKNPDGTQGYTWNPITGCLNNCSYCYAKKLANGRLKERYLANKNYVFCGEGAGHNPETDPFYPRFWSERIYQPAHIKKPCGIFVCDMSELFGDWLPEKWQDIVFQTIVNCPQHRFYLLTKQPQNLTKFSPFPLNCWVGVTATDTASYQDACVGLANVEAKIRFISFEPLLGAIYTQILNGVPPYYNPKGIPFDWVIIGAQTRPNVYPKIEHVEEIVRAADAAEIPVFLKDNLKPLIVIKKDGSEYAPVWANGGYGTLRQEMPK